jgi:hypothetical protein
MVTTSLQRTRLTRRRRRAHVPLSLVATPDLARFPPGRLYELTRTEDRSIGRAVSAFLSDFRAGGGDQAIAEAAFDG